MSKKKYYPNNWENWKELDESVIDPPSFEDFFDWRVLGWELPSSTNCIIRTRDLSTGLVKEFSYERQSAARKRMKLLSDSDVNVEVTICDAEQVSTFKLIKDEPPFDF